MIVLTVSISEDKKVSYINTPLQTGQAELLLDALRLVEREVIKLAINEAREHTHTEGKDE